MKAEPPFTSYQPPREEKPRGGNLGGVPDRRKYEGFFPYYRKHSPSRPLGDGRRENQQKK